MGRMALEGMLDVADRETALLWHLTSNHYPSLGRVFVRVAEEAIDAYNLGNPEEMIGLPDGITHARYGESVPASVVIETLHLDAFLSGGA